MRTRLLPMIWKEFREVRRDPITLWIAAAAPIAFVVLFAYAMRIDFDGMPMAVLNFDRSRESAELTEVFANTGDFAVRYRPSQERDVRHLFQAGLVRLAVIIPQGFGRELAAGRTARVQTLIDGSLAATASVIRSEVEAVTATYSLGLARRASAGRPLPVGPQAEVRVWYNPGLRSSQFIVPGLFGVILMAFPPLLTALAVVREKESGSVQQIYVSPLRPWEFIAGKMLPYVAIAFLELASVMAVGAWWFDVPLRGSLALLLAASALYVFTTVGIGLLVSTLARTQVVATLLALVITVMPSFLFSGFLFPISSMPPIVQGYTHLFPARHFNVLSRGVFLKGAGLAELWPQLAILAVYTAIVFAAASLRFRKKVA